MTPVLAAIARGVLGDGYTPEVPGRVLARIDQFPPADRAKLLSTLAMLDRRPGALALAGSRVPVSRLPAPATERLVQRWQHSRVPPLRQLAKVMVAVAAGALYGYPGPEWDRMGYPGPLGSPPAEEPRRLHPLEITASEQLSCDVVVVGSGAGGGCVAGRLAEAGFDVVVLEKGGYQAEADFTHLEPEALPRLYLYGGTLATSDLGVVIIAGSTLGGGTVVNYTTSFRTPDFLLREWAALSGIESFVSGEFEQSLDEVSQRVGVNTTSSTPGRRDELMEEGLQKLGWDVDVIPRAVRGCTQDEQCGFCGYGCRVGAKQSTMRTFLEDAEARGARMIVNADVRRVFVEDGRAVGVGALVGGGHRVWVRARAVVVAGGAIETPALLLRSGLRGHVGRGLRLHPGIAAFGVFDERVAMWGGTLQARYSRQLRDRDGYGSMFETVPIHPGLGSGALPWVSARQHSELMGNFARLSLCAVLPRDRSAGRVALRRDGTVKVRYVETADDERRKIDGLVAAAKVLEAAGASEVFTMHSPPLSYHPGPGAHELWAEDVRRVGLRGKLTSFSYHQMGSCPMGMDPSSSAVGEDNETHEVQGLFVADGSVFPTASGVNPMLTIYGIANRAAKKIAARLS